MKSPLLAWYLNNVLHATGTCRESDLTPAMLADIVQAMIEGQPVKVTAQKLEEKYLVSQLQRKRARCFTLRPSKARQSVSYIV